MRRLIVLLTVVAASTLLACGGKPTIDVTNQAATGGAPGTTNQIFNISDSGATGGVSSIDSDAGPDTACGNSILETGEQCDDGNPVPGDGCSGVCKLEPNYTCPTPGQPCVSTMICGDGKVTGSEACDDANTNGGDGCSADCKLVEPGFACSTPGQACVQVTTPAVCGNGIVESGETCDDGNSASNDGCSSTCSVESLYTCPTPGAACQLSIYCGDGILNGTEQCDDGNRKPGDCCDGNCNLEANCACVTPVPALSPPKQVCTSTMMCGDSKVTGSEACDDGNAKSGDGCSSDCTTVEPGFNCPSTGGACKAVAKQVCGNGILEAGEYCDDGNSASGDGCSSTCQVENGYVCVVAGKACSPIASCGDATVTFTRGETCDDGNTKSGDGCSPQCIVEQGWVCDNSGQLMTPSQPSSCTYTVKCGDKKIGGSETCDDGNTTSGDGCSSTCQLEPGWVCPVVGRACKANACGDGIVAGTETCDDGGTTSGDGCSATCKREDGWVCPTAGSACRKTVCGDKTTEGSEQCDDGNLVPYDGCSPTCTMEPVCADGTCSAVCGDGLKFPQEACDDENTKSGDGCSSTCQIESGWSCTVVTQSPPSQLDVPILVRDLMYSGTPTTTDHPAGHPDFQTFACSSATTGLLNNALASDGLPTLLSTTGSNQCGTQVTSATSFQSWYHDDPLNFLVNKVQTLTLALVRQTDGSYIFDSATDAPYKAMGGFFPVNNLGWQSAASCAPCSNTNPPSWCSQCSGNNFSFTSELRYPFTFAGGEVLNFTGDDDVWVFINGRLAVDLGGLHSKLGAGVTLDTTHATQLGLVSGGMYEIALFQAERHTSASNYKLTLNGFVHAISQCDSTCGDGIVTPLEACDLGTASNTGKYGTCNSDCSMAPYCGDGTLQSSNELCDDGVNATVYDNAYATNKTCGPACTLPHYCGDQNVDTSYGEICDNETSNSDSAYGLGQCTKSCQLAPYCGDGALNGAEQCDDGIKNGTVASLCDTQCRLKCGNQVLDVGEQCDLGSAKNTGGYGGCKADCSFGPYCGDGYKQSPQEECDDGKNDGSYGTCTSSCKLAGYCGDAVLQNPPESCDAGPLNNAKAYGVGLCTDQCVPAPYCGDKAVDGAFGEKCDDGKNTGLAGSCKPDCSGWVILISCGNGTLDKGEQCDDGSKNGSTTSACDTNCRFRCGNGVVDTGEQCDDGVNDGTYGGCTSTCQYAGYCGDGVKNGLEECDLGVGNKANTYGPGLCTTSCKTAPYCGDGRVQTAYETCDGQLNCTSSCQWWSPNVG